MITGNCPVSFIKGEPYEYKIQFDESMSTFVDKVCISSSRHGFCHYLTRSETVSNEWSYLFTSQESRALAVGRGTYSLTVHCTEPNIDPQILPDQLFEVKANNNECCCQE